MFSDKKENNSTVNKQQNKLSEDTEFQGDMSGKGSFRIEGKLEGKLNTTGKVVVAKTGFIDGELECKNADIEGTVSGKIKVQDTLSLKSTAKIDGEVQSRRLSVEPGAGFNATCTMKEQVKSLTDDKGSKKQQEQSA